MENIMCMNGGDGETSYSSNSLLQRIGILKARPILLATLEDYLRCNNLGSYFKVADLGCSSGPNTMLVVTDIIKTFYQWTQKMKQKPSLNQIQVFLNDLPDNDFNNIFKKLPAFYDSFKKETTGDEEYYSRTCFISGTPGSFYEILFPSESIHLFHSSYSLHWLSQVPRDIENNEKNIYMVKSSPPNVFKAYKEQFERDFSSFLHLRSAELVVGGRMVLTFIARSTEDPTSNDYCHLFEFLSKSLLDLAAEGLVERAALASFNIPLYTPCLEEVKKIVEEEGSFDLDKLQVFEVTLDVDHQDENLKHNQISGKKISSYLRAVMEPTLVKYFGDTTIMDILFAKHTKYVNDHFGMQKINFPYIVMSLTKKGSNQIKN